MLNKNFLGIADLSLDDLNEESELIPLMTSDEEEEIQKEPLPDDLPILPLKNTVLSVSYTHLTLPTSPKV